MQKVTAQPLELNKVYIIEAIHGVNICLATDEEESTLTAAFSDCMAPVAITDLCKRVDNGTSLFFSARIFCTVETQVFNEMHTVTLAESEYLGQCFYDDLAGFIDGGYYEQMRDDVLAANNVTAPVAPSFVTMFDSLRDQAEERIKELCIEVGVPCSDYYDNKMLDVLHYDIEVTANCVQIQFLNDSIAISTEGHQYQLSAISLETLCEAIDIITAVNLL